MINYIKLAILSVWGQIGCELTTNATFLALIVSHMYSCKYISKMTRAVLDLEFLWRNGPRNSFNEATELKKIICKINQNHLANRLKYYQVSFFKWQPMKTHENVQNTIRGQIVIVLWILKDLTILQRYNFLMINTGKSLNIVWKSIKNSTFVLWCWIEPEETLKRLWRQKMPFIFMCDDCSKIQRQSPLLMVNSTNFKDFTFTKGICP